MRTIPSLSLAFALAMPLAGSAQLPTVDLSLQQDDGAGQLHISLRCNDFDFGEVVSNVVFTVRWQESSTATLGFGSSAWCPPPNSGLSLVPSAMVQPGNGYKYRTWSAVGFTLISAIQDDGGCGQTFLADTWTEVLTIPVSNDPGGTVFEIAVDQFTQDDNRGFFVSLNGAPQTGTIFSGTTITAETPLQAGFSLSPNPTTGRATLRFDELEAGPWDLEVTDPSGRLLLDRRARVSAGAKSYDIDLSGLAAGIYQVTLRSAERSMTTPLLLK